MTATETPRLGQTSIARRPHTGRDAFVAIMVYVVGSLGSLAIVDGNVDLWWLSLMALIVVSVVSGFVGCSGFVILLPFLLLPLGLMFGHPQSDLGEPTSVLVIATGMFVPSGLALVAGLWVGQRFRSRGIQADR